MEIYKIIAFAIIASILCFYLKSLNSELFIPALIATGIILLIFSLVSASATFSILLTTLDGISSIISTVSSTYIWRLSERFLKNRIPISKLRSLISLMLQILTVIILALTIAHPIIVLPNAANEYCIILDGSASMSIKQNDKTRFELAKEEIDDSYVNFLERKPKKRGKQ